MILATLLSGLLLASSAGPDSSSETPPSAHIGVAIGFTDAGVELSRSGTNDIDYEPNSQQGLEVYGGYGGWTISGSTTTGEAYPRATHGASSGFVFRTSLEPKVDSHALYVTAWVLRTKGFYVQNSAEVDPTTTDSHPLVRPDIEVRSVAVAATWLFSPDVSYAGTFETPEMKSGLDGSWAVRAGAGFTSIRGDSPLVPASMAHVFSEDASLTAIEGYYTSLSAGFVASWKATWGLFVDFSALAGGNFGLQKYTTTSDQQSRLLGSLAVSVALGCGYAGDFLSAGVGGIVDSDGQNLKHGDVAILRGTVKLFVGLHW